MSLAIKYRPISFKDIVGNEEIVDALQGVLARDKSSIPHSFLFTGLSGGGKTTLARIVANELGCHGSNFCEMNTADFNGIDTIRALRQKVNFAPSVGSKCRVWLIDECQCITSQGQQALLKLLEEAPSHVYFILATTHPEKMIRTIHTRCATFAVEPLESSEISKLIRDVAKAEGKKIPKDVRNQIAEDCLGSAREALSILDTIIDMDSEGMLKVAKRTAEEKNAIIELCRLLMSRSPKWASIAKVVKGLKEEPETIRYAVLGYANACLLRGDNCKAYDIMYAFSENFYDSKKAGVLMACYEVFTGGQE